MSDHFQLDMDSQSSKRHKVAPTASPAITTPTAFRPRQNTTLSAEYYTPPYLGVSASPCSPMKAASQLKRTPSLTSTPPTPKVVRASPRLAQASVGRFHNRGTPSSEPLPHLTLPCSPLRQSRAAVTPITPAASTTSTSSNLSAAPTTPATPAASTVTSTKCSRELPTEATSSAGLLGDMTAAAEKPKTKRKRCEEIVMDASKFSSAKELFDDLVEEAEERIGGIVEGTLYNYLWDRAQHEFVAAQSDVPRASRTSRICQPPAPIAARQPPPQQRKTKVALAPSLSLSSSSPPLGSAPEGTLAMIRQLQEDLHVSQSPEVIACRQKEQRAIHTFIKSHVRDAEAGSLYISGSPGTGKSLSVKAVIRELQEKPQFMQKVKKMVEVCAMTLRSPPSLYPVLLAKLSGNAEHGQLPPLEAARLLQARLIPEKPDAKNNKMVVVVVDEVDGLLDKHQTILYRLFEWAQKVNSRLVLIGIANSMNLTDRFLPRLRDRNCAPELLAFGAYDADQLKTIIINQVEDSMARVGRSEKGQMGKKGKKGTKGKEGKKEQMAVVEGHLGLFQIKALEFCARKVGARSGDVRKCLDICRQCVDDLERELQSDPLRKALVTVADVSRVLRNSYSSGNPLISAMQALPDQQKLILCVAAISVKHTESKEALTIARMRQLYKVFAPRLHLPDASAADFEECLSGLSESSLINCGAATGRAKKGERGAHQVALLVSFDDVDFALCRASPIFARLLADGAKLDVNTNFL